MRFGLRPARGTVCTLMLGTEYFMDADETLSADLVPVAAVEVELVAVGLARGAVADVGVQRMAVVGCLRGAAGPLDRAEPAGDARPGLRGAGDGRPVGGTRPGALGGRRAVGGEPVQGETLGVGEDGHTADRGGLQGDPGVRGARGLPARAG